MPLADLSHAVSPAAVEYTLKVKEKLALSRIEPTVFGRYTVCNYNRGMELPPPHDIVWDGQMAIAEAGEYRFYDESHTPLEIWIDGRRASEAKALRLSAGPHAIFVHHSLARDNNQFIAPVTLMVEGPGNKVELLPMEWLRPKE
jgi:hypothetical protein